MLLQYLQPFTSQVTNDGDDSDDDSLPDDYEQMVSYHQYAILIIATGRTTTYNPCTLSHIGKDNQSMYQPTLPTGFFGLR